MVDDIFKYLLHGKCGAMTDDPIKYFLINGKFGIAELESETLPMTFKAKRTENLKNYRIYGNTINGESVGDLVTDNQSEHYGEYAIPITTNSETANIYLDEPLRKIGDEAEYVDYATQKWNRVRKNLLPIEATSKTKDGVTFTVNADGSVTCNGTATSNAYLYLKILPSFDGACILTGCPSNGSAETYSLQYSNMRIGAYSDIGSGVRIEKYDSTEYQNARVQIKIAPGYTCDNLTFYPMIRKASVTDDTYEPYIKDTEVDVTLPEIAATTGTNTLTIETEVQPSKVYLQGHISRGDNNAE